MPCFGTWTSYQGIEARRLSMIKDIELKRFPHSSGVYKIIWNGSVIYIGSSKDLYHRMRSHKSRIRKGSDHGYKKGFYLFLQNNPFTIEFELTEKYRQMEQDLINQFEPIYNLNAAFTGLTIKEYDKQYHKQWYEVHREEMKQCSKQYSKQYYETHKEEMKQYYKQRYNQLCNYNGEILKLAALVKRLKKQGIPHPYLEVKKYII